MRAVIHVVEISRKASLSRLLRRTTWQAIFKGTPAWARALEAWRNRDDAAALAHFEEFLKWDLEPAAEYMAFYGTLLVLNHRSEEAAAVYDNVLKGKYKPLRFPSRSRYAQAYAHYHLGLIHRRQDAVALWLQAKRQQPPKGFGSKYLPLANSPLPTP